MPLFEKIKDPDRVESAPTTAVQLQEDPEHPSEAEDDVSEVERLRALARQADAQTQPVYAMDAQAHAFLSQCLEQARKLSAEPYQSDPGTEDGYPPSLRVIGVPLLKGDWPTVLNGRESVLATKDELTKLGFIEVRHDYRVVNGTWELRIRFAL